MVLTQQGRDEEGANLQIVSIPLWFLRNGESLYKNDNLNLRFHTTMVLTQPKAAKELSKKIEYVSIPLWFLRNSQSSHHLK